MVNEVIHYLIKKSDKLFLDCTLGEGGHSEEILTRFPGIAVYGLDRHSEILKIARNRLSIFRNRFFGFNVNFKDVSQTIFKEGGKLFDSALIDLGISIYHYKGSKLGFSFSKKEKLDMRLDQESISVYEIINTYSEKELTNIFFKYGEERFSKNIASKIVKQREKETIEYSNQLGEIIESAVPVRFRKKNIHPATKCFQALRIFANNELENIENGLPNVLSLIKKGGRLGVITFHSLEDRIVKKFFNDLYKECVCPAEAPICTCGKKREINWVARMIRPTDEEIENNPASRSSKLRIIEKL